MMRQSLPPSRWQVLKAAALAASLSEKFHMVDHLPFGDFAKHPHFAHAGEPLAAAKAKTLATMIICLCIVTALCDLAAL
jgi:hypothetical protein